MKKFCSVSLLLCVLAISSKAQITITQADMPQPGDAFISTSALVDLSIDPEETGSNHAWNFGTLVPLNSAPDSFYSQSGLPAVYQLFFFGSNLADKSGYNVSFDQFSLEDVYLVYKNSSASLQQYGYAGTFDGIPVPIVYNSKDVIYNFPLEYGNKDSSSSDFAFGLPGIAYVSQNRKRVNEADGWGTITTPVGTFNTLRVKSTITDQDSVYLDTLSTGTNVSLKSYEYKWLAQGSGMPVFQINAQDLLGVPVITQIIYQDTTFHTGMPLMAGGNQVQLAVFPNPASRQVMLHVVGNSTNHFTVVISGISGHVMYHSMCEQKESAIDVSSWENGIYFLEVMENGIYGHQKFVVQHE